MKSTMISIPEWNSRYAPITAEAYIKIGQDIKYVQTVDKLVEAFHRRQLLCLVQAVWENDKSPECFLKIMRGTMEFKEGLEGINLITGLKDLYMLAIEKEGEREIIMTHIRTMVAFIRKIYKDYPEFFSNLQQAVEICNDISGIDVIELLLAKGVLELPMTSARLASWLFQSLKKSLRHNPSLWTNTRGLVVWLAATKLVVGGETDVDAIKMAFDILRDLPLRTNQDVVACLLREIVPELVPYATEFREGLETSDALRPPEDVVFADGSILKAYVPLPYEIKTPNGHTGLTWDPRNKRLRVVPKGFNEFSGVSVELQSIHRLILCGTVLPEKKVGTNGRRILMRTTPKPPMSDTDWKGKLGLTISDTGGGTGNGYGPPSFSIGGSPFPTSGEFEITIDLDHRTKAYKVGCHAWGDRRLESRWETSDPPFLTIYTKGVTDLSYEISETPPPPPPPPTHVVDAGRGQSLTESMAGMRLADMKPKTVNPYSLEGLRG